MELNPSTITDRSLRAARLIDEAVAAYNHPQESVANFREVANEVLQGNKEYNPASALIAAAYQGLRVLEIVGPEADALVKKGLESLGVAVLNS